MLAGVTDCESSRKGGCRGRLALGFKPRHSSYTQGEPPSFGRAGTPWLGQELGPRSFGVLPFAMQPRKQERLCREEKGRKDSCHKKVPHGSGLTGDHCGDRAGGAGTEGLPEPRTSTSFPEIWCPGLGKGGRKDCVCLWVF